ncbi:hypothetical protein [Streptomyces sp. NPDC096012]|uniref:hypothetical protein n=1 Tax=Streptomyces sp. NPDC096012 TaxID=3155684 RepID=UPI00336A427E
MTGKDAAPKRSLLALHDYGMGGSWWWIRARSEREILETFAWVEVVTDPATTARFDGALGVEVAADQDRGRLGLRVRPGQRR